MSAPDCAFCRPDVASRALWESAHYRILADEYPRCAGHVLLVTKDHLASHMHAPEEWRPEFDAARERVRRFLTATFGKAAFYENGGARQEVPHAHLHGLPFHPEIKSRWREEGWVQPITGWDDARREREAAGHYFWLEAGGECFLVRRYKHILTRVRAQLVGQTEARVDEKTSKMLRGGPKMVDRTRRLWERFEASLNA